MEFYTEEYLDKAMRRLSMKKVYNVIYWCGAIVLVVSAVVSQI